MADEDDRPPPPLDRVAAFSDGVFAIAITLLILPLTDSQVRDSHVREDLLALQHQFFAMALSFAVIGRFWLLHHEDLRAMTGAGRRLLVANLVFLFFVVLLPFPTALLGDGYSATATIFYAVAIAATSGSSLLLWWSAERDGVVDERAATRARSRYYGTIALVVAFLPSIPLAFVSPVWARVSWALVVPLGVLAGRLEKRDYSPRRTRPRRTTSV